MNIKVDKEILVNAVQTIQDVIPNKSPLPILSNVLLETYQGKLRLVATDLDIGISKSVPVKIIKKGAITLPARRFNTIIRELPKDEVELTVKKNNTIIIKSGNCIFKLIGIDSEEFPSLPKIEEGDKIEIDGSILKNILQVTSFAISTDETRYVLNGLLFILKDKKLTVVATDGRRLAFKRSELEIKKLCDVKVIIPHKTIHQLEKMIDGKSKVLINIGDTQVLFQIGDTLLMSRLIEGEFPDYTQVIPPESENKFLVNRDAFLNAIRRANILTTTDSMGVKLDVLKNEMVISKNTPDIGEIKEKISGSYKGKDLSISFNPNYLIDILKNYPEDELSFELTQPEKPGVIRLNKTYLYLVLPMQLG